VGGVPDLEPRKDPGGRLIEVLANDVTLEGTRRVKVVSDAPLDPYPPALSPFVVQIEKGSHRTWCDELLGLHYLEVTWPCREVVSIRCEGWTCAREMVLWKLAPGERVSEALMVSLDVYCERFKCLPDYAFMRRLPKTIENGFEALTPDPLPTGEGVVMLEAEWVPAGCMAICEGEQPPSGFAQKGICDGLEAMVLQK